MISDVRFGAFLAYSPRGTSEISRRSEAICRRIKADGPSHEPLLSMVEYAVQRLPDRASDDLLRLLDPRAVLIPMPRSAPFPPKQPNVLWVPRRICESLVAQGLGASVLPCVERVAQVPKSAFARPGERPTVQAHLDSMRVTATLEPPERIVLVDDVVTKGATLLAAASVVRHAFPEADVACFALIRTLGLQPEIERIVDPIVGVIKNRRGEADRQP